MSHAPQVPTSIPDLDVNSPTFAAKSYSKRHLTELLIKRARDIKMLPAIAMQAIAMADDPETTVSKFCQLIAQDAKLTTSVLSLANSPVFPVYATGRKISNLEVAVTRLGFRQTKQMILVSCYSSMVNSMQWQEQQTRELLSRHSFMTGVISSELNSLLKLGLQGEEFTAGLLHDVGRILLAVTIPNDFPTFDKLDFQEDNEVLEREKQILGTNHAEIGAWFLSRNQLTDDLISVARYHHTPTEASRYARLVALVAVADDLANYSMQELKQGSYDASNLESLKLLEMLGVQDAVALVTQLWEQVLEKADETYAQLASL